MYINLLFKCNGHHPAQALESVHTYTNSNIPLDVPAPRYYTVPAGPDTPIVRPNSDLGDLIKKE